MNKLILYIVVLFSLSCQESKKENNVLSYFDTSEFVNTAIKELTVQGFTANKEIVLNEKTETKNVINLDSTFLSNEFKLLKSANINKPALLGFYTEDTLAKNNEMQIKYFPLAEKESKFKTKELNLIYNADNSLEEVSVVVASENFMHAYRKELVYITKQSLIIKSWEKTMFQDTLFYETKLTLIKK